MRLAIVILNWNGRHFLEQYLPLLVERSPQWAQVVIADNASTDDSVAWAKTHFPQVQLLINDKNYGFAEGYNKALQQIDAQYFCLLNSDIEVHENWLDSIIDYMDAHPEVGICQPKLLSIFEKEKFEYAGAAGGYIDKYGYPFCRGRIFNHLETDNGQYDDEREIFWATGACMFVRSELYRQLNGLDGDFFAHMEEIDFCWRAKIAGTKIMYYPQSIVYHVGGGTLPKKSSKKTFLNFRNNMLLLYKNLPDEDLRKVFFVRFWLDIVAAFSFLLSSGWGDFAAVFKARHAFKTMKNDSIAKRKTIQPHSVTMIYEKSIVMQHYLKGVRKFSQLKEEDFRKF